VNYDGSVVTAWPPPKKEIINAANAFRNVGDKSKGFVVSGFSEVGHVIYYSFFESEESFMQNSVLNIQMFVNMNTINDIRLMETPYHMTIYNAEAVKRLHRDVIYDMFRFWFDAEADKAMAEFDRYLDYAIRYDQEHRIEEITYNDRLMFFYRVGGTDGFTLSINSK
jgi:hypothetical protein